MDVKAIKPPVLQMSMTLETLVGISNASLEHFEISAKNDVSNFKGPQPDRRIRNFLCFTLNALKVLLKKHDLGVATDKRAFVLKDFMNDQEYFYLLLACTSLPLREDFHEYDYIDLWVDCGNTLPLCWEESAHEYR